MPLSHPLRRLVVVLSIASAACSSSGSGNNLGSGGGPSPGAGGAYASGGTTGTGSTTTATGGMAGSGGSLVSSGVSGGQSGSGGTLPSSGGRVGSGGVSTVVGSGGRASGGASSIATAAAGGSSGSTNSTSASGGAGGAAPGCGSANTSSPCGTKGTTCSLTVAGTNRTYYVQLPKSYSATKPYPLIFQFHPWGGSADQALTMYGLISKIPDAIYVTPQGLDAGGNGPGWANTNGQDIAFTKAMLADVQSKYCVDNTRIFSTGFSYGGMMSFAIGCEMSDVFRAIAPMSGSLYSDFNCKGTGPHVAMWGSHGLNDTVVPIDDGRSALKKILQENHCGTTTAPVDPSPCVKYQGCDPGYEVTWCEWDGPHGIPSFGSAAIAAFFQQF